MAEGFWNVVIVLMAKLCVKSVGGMDIEMLLLLRVEQGKLNVNNVKVKSILKKNVKNVMVTAK